MKKLGIMSCAVPPSAVCSEVNQIPSCSVASAWPSTCPMRKIKLRFSALLEVAIKDVIASDKNGAIIIVRFTWCL